LPLLWIRLGHWFYLSIDEGIYLEGARRIARGQVPYRDFFVITGPGSFWLYGAVFHFFGVSLANARLVLCCELAALCAAVCWLAGRVTGALFAAASGLLFLAMLLTTLYPLYITHRWDSNTFALVALAFVWAAHTSEAHGQRWFTGAGVCAGIAAWITPPLLSVVLVLALWIALQAKSRRGLRLYAAGIALPSAAAAVVLLYSGAFGSMVRSLVWDTSNYATANRLAYGALTGSFQSFWHAGSGLARNSVPRFLAAVVHFADSILPALLPFLAALGCLVFLRPRSPLAPGKKSFLWLLAAGALASLVACYPRFGAAQLLFGSAFFWALCSVSAGCLLPKCGQVVLAAAVFLVAGGAVFAGWPDDDLKRIETPAGDLKVSKRHHILLNDLLSTIRPGESLFVYPYLPALYFVLGGDNPTRYSWLQPGMMGPREVQGALAELETNPPRWIIRHDFTEDFILKNWPSSDRTRMQFPEMERFLGGYYHVVNPDGVIAVGYRLLERNQ
ncbi:MAG: hypothetical protein ABUS51_08750, partial [Acidobacteriota bacterium]